MRAIEAYTHGQIVIGYVIGKICYRVLFFSFLHLEHKQTLQNVVYIGFDKCCNYIARQGYDCTNILLVCRYSHCFGLNA